MGPKIPQLDPNTPPLRLTLPIFLAFILGYLAGSGELSQFL